MWQMIKVLLTGEAVVDGEAATEGQCYRREKLTHRQNGNRD